MVRVPNILYFSALIVEIILSLFDTQPNFIAKFLSVGVWRSGAKEETPEGN
jgi:hypothetical protein